MARLPYLETCLLLRATAELLNLPANVIATALVLCHRWHSSPPEHLPSPDAPLRTNDLLNSVRHLAGARDRSGIVRAFPGLPSQGVNPAGIDGDRMLVDKDYYAAKDVLITDEQVLLRLTQFNLCFDHPYRYLLNYARTIGCGPKLVRVAVALVNDSLMRTSMCLSHEPYDVAAGALHLASLVTGEVHDIPYMGTISWWDALGVGLSTVERIGHELCDLLPNAWSHR